MPVTVATPADLAAIDDRIDGLEARTGALETRPASRVCSTPWVGAYVGKYGDSDPDFQALWDASYRDLGPLAYARCFDSAIPAPGGERWRRIVGPRHVYSLKPPAVGGVRDWSGWVAGAYTEPYQAVCRALPPGTLLTVLHEPENDMGGDRYLEVTRRALDDLRAVRPDPADVTYLYVAMAYQWGVLSGNTATVAPWLAAARLVDMVTVDVYAPAGDFGPMSGDAGFARWWVEVVERAGKPWGVTERGISDHAGESARMDVLAADWQHITRHGGRLLSYYNADWKSGAWQLKGAAEKALYGRLAASGRCR